MTMRIDVHVNDKTYERITAMATQLEITVEQWATLNLTMLALVEGSDRRPSTSSACRAAARGVAEEIAAIERRFNVALKRRNEAGGPAR